MASAEFTPVDKKPSQDLVETGRKQQNALFIFICLNMSNISMFALHINGNVWLAPRYAISIV
jgi:hypothetical protein